MPWGRLVVFSAALVVIVGCAPVTDEPSDGVLRVGLSGAPSGLDPHLQNEALATTILANVFDTLVCYDERLAIEPSLAIRWENPDELRWRFHLRRGVVFHDGSILDAEDVVFSFDRARGIGGTRVAAYLTSVVHVEAVDSHTVDVITASPDAALLVRLTRIPIVGAHSPALITSPIGSGPYIFAGRGGEEETVVLKAFDMYWGAPPAIERVSFLAIEDQTARVDALLAGNVDLIIDLAADSCRIVEAAEGVSVKTSTNLEVTYLQLRPDSVPFDDIRVRQAVHYGLGRSKLVETMLGGRGMPVGQMANPNLFGYAEGLDSPPRDLQQARRLLDEVGAGARTLVVLEHRDNIESEPLVQQLAEIGLDVQVIKRPWNEMYPRLVGEEIVMYLGRWNSTTGDTSELFDAKVHTPDSDRGYGDSNTYGYSNPELDRLIEEATRILDVRARRQILATCMRRLMADFVLIPLWAGESLYGVDEDLQWRPRLDGRILVGSVEKTGAPGRGSS